MPELPEVEVIRRQLVDVAGRTVVHAWARDEPRWSSAAQARGVVGPAGRVGKFLVVPLGDPVGESLVLHLGMTGRLELGAPATDHVCAWWELSDGRRLSLCDPRRFGRAVLCEDPADELPELGADPLSDSLDLDAAAAGLTGRARGAKELLLSQQVVCGAGNYLVDETLRRAGVHPEARMLDRGQARAVLDELVALVHDSVAAGGASLRDYRSLAGRGRTQELLRCYGRAGQPCDRCGSVLVRSRVAGRGTTTCPVCQGGGPPARSGPDN